MIHKEMFSEKVDVLKGSVYGRCGYCDRSFGLLDWFLREVHIDDNGYVCKDCFDERYHF